MAVGIMAPQLRQQNKESDLDKVSRALTIAQNILGIKDSFQNASARETAAGQQKTLFEQQQQEHTRKQDELAQLQDPNSNLSMQRRMAYQQAGLKVDPSASGYELQQTYGETGPLIKEVVQARNKPVDPNSQLLREYQIEKAKREQDEAAYKKTPKGKLEGMPASDKQRYDNIVMAIGAVKGMEDALLGKGQNTFSLIGDNDFTLSANQWDEAIGRMQSGGAIQVDEAKKFRALAPKFTDSPEMQQKKLAEARKLMEQRFGTFGFSSANAGDLGLDPNIFVPGQKGKPVAGNGQKMYNLPEAKAAKVYKTNEIEWAD